jgi:hypothetical protein
MRYKKSLTTHIPILLKAVQTTSGPVMELGSNPHSTPLLHWLCAEENRKLITYESDLKYFQQALTFKSRNHSVKLVKNWDEIDLTKNHWSVVFINHNLKRRKTELIKFKNVADYLILKNTEEQNHKYRKVWSQFKYVHHWKLCKTWTTVVSNFRNPKNLDRTRIKKMSNKEDKTYVVIGCPRSATSFVSQCLSKNGVDMGHESSSRYAPYYEDQDFVKMDKKLTRKAKINSERFPREETILKRDSRDKHIKKLIKSKSKKFWGFKSPLAALTIKRYLPYLDGDAYLICCFRKPEKLIQSSQSQRGVIDREFVDHYNKSIISAIREFVGLR